MAPISVMQWAKKDESYRDVLTADLEIKKLRFKPSVRESEIIFNLEIDVDFKWIEGPFIIQIFARGI